MELTTDETEAESKADPFDAIIASVKGENPGTEIWLGGHPRTGERWIYRPATQGEANIYKKLQRAENAKGDLGDPEIPYTMLVGACVLYPKKDGLAKLFAMRPMLRQRIAAEVCDVTGLAGDLIQKKL